MRLVELFAGIGAFRLGFEAMGYETVWWNQWEPSIKAQHGHGLLADRFHGGEAPAYSNAPIQEVPSSAVPDCDVIVGGLPCQDYSVAATLDRSGGITGKKGVLWWDMHRLIQAKRPRFVVVENVDRLLKSPAGKRGRDFGIMLSCLRRLGYVAEWRVVTASDHGCATSRKRVFVLAARADTAWGRRIASAARTVDGLATSGFFAQAFPCKADDARPVRHTLPDDLEDTNDWSARLLDAGAMVDGDVFTRDVEPVIVPGPVLGDVLRPDAPEDRFLEPGAVEAWKACKGAKATPRKAANGHVYVYREGACAFPDDLSRPARTILTAEGGRGPNRSTHVVQDGDRLRLLSPEECEAIMGFPEGWTAGMPQRWRYFTLGNALVVDLARRVAEVLADGPAPAGLSMGSLAGSAGVALPGDAGVQARASGGDRATCSKPAGLRGGRFKDGSHMAEVPLRGVDAEGWAEPWPGIHLPWTAPVGGPRRTGRQPRPLCPVCLKATVALGHKDGAKSQWRFMRATVGREVVMCREHGLFLVRRLE